MKIHQGAREHYSHDRDFHACHAFYRLCAWSDSLPEQFDVDHGEPSSLPSDCNVDYGEPMQVNTFLMELCFLCFHCFPLFFLLCFHPCVSCFQLHFGNTGNVPAF